MTWILGGYQTDFSRHWTREGRTTADLVAETLGGTWRATGLEPSDIEVIHASNTFGEQFTGQGHMGAMPASVEPALVGVASSRHEAACAAGGVSIMAAMADLESGRYDVALVIGAEIERNLPGEEAAEHMRAAVWVGHDAPDARYVWPWSFSELANEYDKRFGLDDQYLHAIAELNFRNARANPNAQSRNWSFTPESFTDNDEANPVVEGRLRKTDCSQITDGAAAIVLVSDRAVERFAGPKARITGWGHRTDTLSLADKLAASADGPYVFPQVRRAITDAYDRAGVGVEDLDLIETHDCFTPTEYMAIDHFGITPPGDSWKAIESGDLEIDGRIPVNPSGGLIGIGHPVGATGIRMGLDAWKQLTDQAGGFQVAGARRVGTLNIGGSGATAVSMIIEASGV